MKKITTILPFILICNYLIGQIIHGPEIPINGHNLNNPNGSENFQSISSAYDSDDNYSTVFFEEEANGISNYVVLEDFGFNINSGLTITGIEVRIERSILSMDDKAKDDDDDDVEIYDYAVYLIDDNGKLSATNLAIADKWTSDDKVITYGGQYETWGESWEYSAINSSSFGVVIAVNGISSDDDDDDDKDDDEGVLARIDQVQVIVYTNRMRRGMATMSHVDSYKNGLEFYTSISNGGVNIISRNQLDKVMVYDITGKIIKTYEGNGTNNFTISNLSSGIYFLKVTELDQKESVQKIVID